MEVYLDTGGSGQWSRHNATQRLGHAKYIAWTYVPSIIFVLYGTLWQVIDGEVKRLEKYRQLATDKQCTAAQSFNLNYHSFWAPLAILQAFRYRQWSVMLSSLGLIFAGIVIPNLQNYVLTWEVYCGQALFWGGQDCVQLAYADAYWSKCLISALSFTLACALGLVWSLRKYPMDLSEDPRGLEFLVALTAFKDPNDLNALRDLQDNFPVMGYPKPRLCVLKFEYFIDADGVARPSLKYVGPPTPPAAVARTRSELLSKVKKKIPRWISSNVELLSLISLVALLFSALIAAIHVLLRMNSPEQHLLQDYQLPWSPNLYLVVGTFVQVSVANLS